MSDAEVMAELTAVRGIGAWTAEIFLIFNQLRRAVLPLDDIACRMPSPGIIAGESVLRASCFRHTASAGAPGVRWPPGTCGAVSIRFP